ncbi:hypothetical protein L484_004643 [Morus notabilis]|uniref:Uncharacterized protein n=1 Tax=Morus notabilis TaxID=981085 RepID=W9RHA6_9ROSA|nr:hypothetical protein L484_004643 [Morus notabilis]
MLRLFASVSKSLAGVLRAQVEEPAPAAVVEPSQEEPEHAAVPENSVIRTYESGVHVWLGMGFDCGIWKEKVKFIF